MDDFRSMITAHNRLQPNNFSLAISGWTLGPGPETNPRGSGGWINDQLPSNVSIGAMNVECGHAPPDPGFAELPNHATITIPWMEDDGGVFDCIRLSSVRTVLLLFCVAASMLLLNTRDCQH